MPRENAAWWLASAGIHVVIALVTTLLFYETRATIGRPGMTVLCLPERPRLVADDWRQPVPISGTEEPRIVDQDNWDGELEDVPSGELWERWILTEGGDPSGEDEDGGGGRGEVHYVT